MVDYGGPEIRARALNGKVSTKETALDRWIAELESKQAPPPSDPLSDLDLWIAELEAKPQQKAPGAAPVPRKTLAEAGAAPSIPPRRPDAPIQNTEIAGAGLAVDQPEPFNPPNVEAMEVINQIRQPAFEAAEKAGRDERVAELAKLPAFTLERRQKEAQVLRQPEKVQLLTEALQRKAAPPPAPEIVYATPEEEPGAWARFTQPWKNLANLPAHLVVKASEVNPALAEAVEREARFRMERGLYDPGEANDIALRDSIARELELGLPMYDEAASKLQQRAYERMAAFGPKHFPHAKGFWNKAAQAGGDLTVLITELAVMRKAGLNKLIGRVAPPQLAGPLALGTGFAGSAALHGQDPRGIAEEFQTGMMLGGIGKAAGAITRTAPQTLAAAGVGGMFAGKTAAEGGDPLDVFIAGILVPLAFHGRGMSREVVRGLARSPAAADKVLGRAVEAVQAGRDASAEVRRLVRGLTDGTLSLSKEGRRIWRELRRPAGEAERRLAIEAGERSQPVRELQEPAAVEAQPQRGPTVAPPRELQGATPESERSVFEPAVEARDEEAMRAAGLTPAKAVPEQVPEPPKQPWEMTRDDYANQYYEGHVIRFRDRQDIRRGRDELIAEARQLHVNATGQALAEGKPVPPEVLKDYPELAKDALPVRPDEKAVRRAEEAGRPAPGGEPPGVGRGEGRVPAAERPAKEAAPVEPLPAEPREVPVEQNFAQFLRERGVEDPGLEHGALGPSGRMSKQARAALDKRRDAEFAAFAKAQDEYRLLVESGEIVDPTGKVRSTKAAEAYDRKHKLIEATGFTPPRSAEVMGAVAGPAETNALYDVVGKITNYVKGSPERVRERELAKRIFRQRRGRVGLAGVDVHEMGKEFTRLEKEIASPEEVYNLHQAMVGKHPTDVLPEAQADWVRKARALHDRASLDLLGELLKTQGETALTESIRQNMGTYLAETLTPKRPIERVKALVSRRHKLRGEQFKFKRDKWAVQVGRSHFKFETKAEAKEAHDALLRNELTAVIRKKALERGVTADDLKKAAAAKKVKLVEPLTEEQRLEMGFSRNPMFTWATSYVKTRHNAETLRVFRLLDKRFAQDAPTDVAIGGDKAIADWAKENNLEQVKGDKNVVGVLADRYLPKHIAKDVNELTKVPGLVERWYGAYLQAWKSSKTIWNPPTHMRNIFGNFMFADLADVAIHDPRNWKYYKAAMADLIAKGSDYRLLVREGVIGGEYYGNEVKQILVRMEKGDAPDLALLKLGQLLHEKLGRLYNAEDQVFKLAAFLKYRSRGMNAKTAAREVNRWFPNYAELHPWTKKVSRSPWGGPFLAFNEQAIRIAGRAAIRHPLKLAKWAAIPGAMTAFATYYLGIGEDEKDLIDSRRSSFEPLLPVRDKDGAVQKLDLRYIIPIANELQKIIDYATGKSGRIEVPFLLQNPPISGWNDVVYNKSLFTGRQIVSPEDGLKTKIVKHIGHMLWESAPIPTSFTWGRQRLQRAFSDKSDEHVVTAIAGALFGVNIRAPYVSRQDAYDRIRTLAEKDPAVARVMDRLLDGRTKSISYGSLSRSLNRNDRFQDLLDIYNQAYRYSGGKEIKPKGILQSIRGRAGEEAKKKKGTPISRAEPRRPYRPLPENLSFRDLARTA